MAFMFSKIWMFNIILVACAIFFGIRAHDVWTGKEKTVPKKQAERAVSRPEKRSAGRRTAPESAYRVIADRNLFSPDRKEFIPEEPEKEKEPEPEVRQLRVSGKTVTLYGVIMTDNYKSALISNPVRGDDERKHRWIKKGDKIGDIAVADIQKESILLTEGDKKYEILLYDRKKSGTKNTVEKNIRPTVVISESEKKQPAVSKSKKQESSDDEYEIINTPFGKIRRKKRK